MSSPQDNPTGLPQDPIADKAVNSKVQIMVSKTGPAGRPVATIFVAGTVPLGAVTATLQKNLTRNADLLKRLGLKACQACISGFDLDIRHRFEEVMQVDLERISGL